MNQSSPSPADAAVPVFKVGLVLLRDLASDDPQVLFTRIKPKANGKRNDLGLPKGSRQYWYIGEDGKKKYSDVRSEKAALEHADRLVGEHRTLLDEAYQEIGVKRADLRDADVFELGVRAFTSRSQGEMKIRWAVAETSPTMERNLNPNPPDAEEVQWLRLSEFRALVEAGQANAGYADVAEEAAHAMKAQTLTRFAIPAAQPVR